MTELTHAMETLLDQVRNHRAAVNTEIVDSLLNGLDTLKVLKQKLVADDGQMPDIKPVVSRIQSAAQGGPAAIPAAASDTKVAADPSEEAVRAAWKRGEQLFRMVVTIDPQTKWPAVRCFQALSELNRMGKVLWSSPSSEEIQEEKAGHNFTAIFATTVGDEKIRDSISSIGDVKEVTLTEHQPAKSDAVPVSVQVGMEVSGSAAIPEAAVVKNESAELPMTASVESAPPIQSEARGEQSSERVESLQSVRIDVRVLDNLMNMVEELVIDRSRISQVSRMLESRYTGDELISNLGQTSNHIVKVINDLQQDIMKVRMVPISVVFNKMPRMVRDLAQKQGKLINFEVTGGDTELDRSIIEQIRDPIIHLLRNSVDHGIELPADRKLAGKAEKATVRLAAFQEESHIIITVDDDGKGIDAARVRAAAVRKGMITADAATKLTDHESIEMMFMPGLSTAEKTTEVSGRGVGLDIVRTNIEKLNGTVGFETRVGKGTKFIVQLPLTVAVFQGLLVSSGSAVYVIPLASVLETLRISRAEVSTIMGHEVTRLRENVIPLIRMNEVLGKSEELRRENQHEYVIVIKAGEKQAGIIVDRLMEQQEFVIKPLGSLGDVKGIAGASILGDGQVALIIDVPTLTRMANNKNAALRAAQITVA
jgi:two-component system chemotaxis sensor kinase CheA